MRRNARRVSRSIGRPECGIIEYELIWNQRCSHELVGGGGKRDVQMGVSKRTVQSMSVLHAEWKVRVFLHGDDVASVGSREALRKFETKMEQRF